MCNLINNSTENKRCSFDLGLMNRHLLIKQQLSDSETTSIPKDISLLRRKSHRIFN